MVDRRLSLRFSGRGLHCGLPKQRSAIVLIALASIIQIGIYSTSIIKLLG